MPIIQLKNAGVQFAEHVIFKNLNLEVQKGECLVIIGPSGQGKTTLLKTLSSLISPQSGALFYEHENVLTLSSAKLAAWLKKMGMLFQKNALFDSLTCAENIAFPLRETTKLSEQEIQSRVDDYLEAVGISHTKKLFPDELSGGMQKRLGIARALALDPEIVFYDDPTAGLDPITSRKIIDLILQLKKDRGMTVIAITNDMHRAFQMADRIVMLAEGELIVLGTPEEARAHLDPRVQQFVRGQVEGPLGIDRAVQKI